MFTRIFSIIICLLLIAQVANAQLRTGNERKIQLLEQLRITETQRIQLQQLIQEEKLQELWRSKKLQQILTPQQIKKLQQLRKEKLISTDTTVYKNKLP